MINRLINFGMTYDQAWLLVESGVAQDYFDQLKHYDHIAEVAKCQRGISKKARFEIFMRDGFRCQLCGKSAKDGVTLEIDHIHPISKGGTNEPDNLWVLCYDCNRGKGAQIIAECGRILTAGAVIR